MATPSRSVAPDNWSWRTNCPAEVSWGAINPLHGNIVEISGGIGGDDAGAAGQRTRQSVVPALQVHGDARISGITNKRWRRAGRVCGKGRIIDAHTIDDVVGEVRGLGAHIGIVVKTQPLGLKGSQSEQADAENQQGNQHFDEAEAAFTPAWIQFE
jgi:hypothetical protein